MSTLTALTHQMLNVSDSKTCICTIAPIRGTKRVRLTWEDKLNGVRYQVEFLDHRATLTNPAYVNALENAKKVMRKCAKQHNNPLKEG
jgi:hypothetical protein